MKNKENSLYNRCAQSPYCRKKLSFLANVEGNESLKRVKMEK